MWLRSIRVVPALACASLGLLCAPALTVAAAPGAYVALGDSYSAGVGAPPYIEGSGFCQRSHRSYAYRLGRPLTSFRACAGAVTSDVLDDQLRRFPRGTTLVTLTIGGNDAGFVDVVATCLLGDGAACGARVDTAARFIRNDLRSRLRHVLSAVRARARRATVVVAGYPRLFAGKRCRSASGIDAGEQRRLNAASDLLDTTIAAEVHRHARVRFADVRKAFRGHGVCSGSPWINGFGGPITSAAHPNSAGYRAYARVIRARLR